MQYGRLIIKKFGEWCKGLASKSWELVVRVRFPPPRPFLLTLNALLGDNQSMETLTKQFALKPLPPLKVGDKVIRYLCGQFPMPMVVLKVTPELITCGGDKYPGAAWEFEPKYGCEVDEEVTKGSGLVISFIVPAPEGVNAA